MNWSPRILIAERDATVRTLLISLITTQYPTARIAAVPDGLAALATYAAHGADLVITAQRLPGVRGLDLVRALRAEQAALPILLLSADAGLEADALDAGASAFLPKLAPFAALRQALTTLLPPHVARTV